MLTIEEKPFVTTQKIESKAECLGDGKVLCPWFNSSGEGSDLYCCTGYCIDLLNTLANKINFTFELALSPDGQFGSLQMRESTGIHFFIFLQERSKGNSKRTKTNITKPLIISPVAHLRYIYSAFVMVGQTNGKGEKEIP